MFRRATVVLIVVSSYVVKMIFSLIVISRLLSWAKEFDVFVLSIQ